MQPKRARSHGRAKLSTSRRDRHQLTDLLVGQDDVSVNDVAFLLRADNETREDHGARRTGAIVSSGDMITAVLTLGRARFATGHRG